MNWKLIARLGCAMLSLTAVSNSLAQGYPNRSLRMIVPYAAGGGADITGRVIAQKLTEVFGHQVVVDNRPGAAGNIGAELAARSAPDGYTVVLVGPNHTTNLNLFAKLNYDPIKDFEPISLVTAAPYVLLVHPSVPARNLKELIALARSKPGQLTYGSAGNGTAGHLAFESIKTQAKIDILHVPYKGSPPLQSDLIGGQVVAGFDNVLSSMPHVKAGRLRAFAVSGSKRTPAMPDVPTVAEAALPGFDVTVWQGILAPAGTPREIVARLNAEIVSALQKPDVQSRMAALGVDIIGSSPQEFAAFIKRDIEKWAVVIKASGARID
jgi:tripartite-type tricarboxylate transporter receptor subunit TctC